MTGIAAIDIGSNAIRLGIGFAGRAGAPVFVEEIREPIRLGDGVFKTGIVSEPTIVRAERAFERFHELLKRHGVTRYRAVATSALREARNRTDFVARIKRASGIAIDVISGEEEARLIFTAVREAVSLKGKLALLVDIGGGSVEVSLVRNGAIVFSESLKLGAVRLLELLRGRQHANKICARLVRGYVSGLRRQLPRSLRRREIDLVVGTGGNIEELGDLRRRRGGKKNNRVVDAKELEDIVTMLSRMSIEERVSTLALRPDRADVILPAAIIVREMLRHTKVKRLVVPRVGLKEGIVQQLLQQSKKSSPDESRRAARMYALEVGRRLQFDEEHAEAVTKWALKFFDELRQLHRCSDDLLLPFEVAALLHDVGHIINVNGHHKHSYYLIHASPLVGLTDREREIAACIARYHRKSAPKLEHPEFAALESPDRATVTRLAAILRLADACDSGHTRAMRRVGVGVRGKSVELKLHGEGDLLLERWSLSQKAAFFEATFGCSVIVR